MQRKWKRNWNRIISKKIVPCVVTGLLLLSVSSVVNANPTGGVVTSGTAQITQQGATMTVTQSTDKAAMNWQSFNIGAGEKVQFVQPSASSVALNRVVGNNASSIYGTLSANGKVFLINPNGVLFAPGAQVNVGGLVASTLNISDRDFSDGKYTFSGSSTGSVVNAGNITAAQQAVLIGPQVKNEGVIAARTVGLVTGSKVSLDFSGDKLLNFTVDTQAAGGSAENSGTLTADGGLVIMSAGTKDALLNTVINNSGIIRAQTVNQVDGVIRLEGSTVNVGGTLDASAPSGGNGGFIETSGATVNLAPTATITTAAPQGKTGTWLIDPTDITIKDTYAQTLISALNTSSIEVSTAMAVGTDGNGDITVDIPITWTSNNTLTLTAERNIAINQAITGVNGGLTLNAVGTITAPAAVNVGTFTLNSGTWRQVAATLPAFSAIHFCISGGTFLRALGGDGTSSNAYQIADVYGLQGIGSSGMLGLSYVLANDIDASGTGNWNNNAGFVPIGDDSTKFTGTFDGNGHTITGLTIDRHYSDNVGLFGYTAGATIQNTGLISGSVQGRSNVGGLVGWNDGRITNCYSTGQVTGLAYVGGLVGYNDAGSIMRCYSTGSVNAGSYVGGLVGWNDCSTITSCYSTGLVTGNINYVGGLVGYNNDGSITSSYSTGQVNCSDYVGGLVGYNENTITSCYWDVDPSGQANGVGDGATSGVTGLYSDPSSLTADSTRKSALSQTSYTGWDFTSTWYQDSSINNGYPILRSSPYVLTIQADNKTMTCGNAVPTFTYTYNNLWASDTARVITGLNLSSTATSALTAGTYTISPSGAHATSSTGNPYTIIYEMGTLTIAPAPTPVPTPTPVPAPTPAPAPTPITIPSLAGGAYLGAIGSARQSALPIFGNPHMVRFTGFETVLPLTIIPPGINISGYVPLTVFGDFTTSKQ